MQEQKLEFHEICLSDQKWIKEKLEEDNLGACEYTFANNYLWRKVYHTEVTQFLGCGIIRFVEEQDKKVVYSFPFGNGDKRAVIEELRRECHELGRKLDLYPIVDEDRLELLEWFPGEFEIDADRDDFDYVYTVEKLSTLKGKKLHGKRNHIARFKDEDDWSYESMSESNIGECQRMAKEWIQLREEKWNEEMEQEMNVLLDAFSHFEELGLVGGVLRKKEQIVAFAIGEPLNSDSFVVHFEKAFPDLQGAYPMINQQFVLHECQEFSYVNREEDTGDLGLRKAKLSYYPDILLRKYRAVESHVVFASERDTDAIQKLWQTCFGDGEEYIQFYLENRFETENMLVIHEDGRPVSMASFFPAELVKDGERIPVRYVYAVATLPEYRRKGYASEIIKYAFQKYQEPLILQPAGEDLEAYYEKLGFQNYFAKDSFEMTRVFTGKTKTEVSQMESVSGEDRQHADDEGNCNEAEAVCSHADCECVHAGWCFKEITPSEYKKIRDAYYEERDYISWNDAAIEYAVFENNFCGGSARKLVSVENAEDWIAENTEEAEENREELLLYRKKDRKFRIIETTLEVEEIRKLALAILDSGEADEVIYENHGGMILFPAQDIQICQEEQQCIETLPKAYLNLTLG